MDQFLRKNNRSRINSVFQKLDYATGTQLSIRYGEWLRIMEACKVDYRHPIPAGISGCLDFLIKKEDREMWIQTENLVAPTPEIHNWKYEDYVAYDCGISYYFRNKDEVKSIIAGIEMQLRVFSLSRSPWTDEEKKLYETLIRLKNKTTVYDRIITCIAIHTMGMDAIPMLDGFLFYNKIRKDTSEAEKSVYEELIKLENDQCCEFGIAFLQR